MVHVRLLSGNSKRKTGIFFMSWLRILVMLKDTVEINMVLKPIPIWIRSSIDNWTQIHIFLLSIISKGID